MNRILSHRATLLASFVIAAAVCAQDDPWKAEVITVESLSAAADALKAEIKPLADDATDDQKAWDAARRKRLAGLNEFTRLWNAVESLQSQDDAEAQVRQWAKKTDALRDSGPEPVPPIREDDDIAPLNAEDRAAKAAVKKIEGRIKQLTSIAADAEKRLTAMPKRRTELKEIVTKAGNSKPDSISAYRAGTAQLELRMLAELDRDKSMLRERISDETKIRTSELDYAKLASRRSGERLDACRKALESFKKEALDRQKKETPDAPKADVNDVVAKWSSELKRTIEDLERALKEDELTQSELVRRATTENALLERYNKQFERLSERAHRTGAVSSAGARRLHDELSKVDSRQESIRRLALPRVQRELMDIDGQIVTVQDEEWDLELAPADTKLWKKRVESLPEERRAEGADAFDKLVVGADGLRAKLRARLASLSKTHRSLSVIESNYTAQLDTLTKIENLIRKRIYWVRVDPPLWVDVATDLPANIQYLADFYAETEFVGEMSATFEAQPVFIVGAFLLLIFLLVGSTIAARRVKSHRMTRPEEGHRLKGGIADAARMLLHAAVPSLVLLGAVQIVERMEMPERVAFPILEALDLVAVLLFLQRLAWGLLNENGYLVQHFRVKPEVGQQTLRSVRMITLSAMLFHVPELILREVEGDQVNALLRLFATAFRASQLTALALLLPRRKPVAQAFVQGSETGTRVVGVIGPIIAILLLTIFAMDLLGFRYGAEFFTERAVETFLTIFILRGVYSGLNQISERVVARVRKRAYSESGSKAAWEDSEKLAPQLSRVITIMTLVAAMLVLARSWDIGETVGGMLEEWPVYELSGEDNYISAQDVLASILWIFGAHFFASNIAGVFELLIFPIFGSIHPGTRYVVLALSRYLILLIGYSAALVSLHFSVQSITWLLTAASVGLGFGLQEIVANFVSGLILLVEQPVRVGDVISVADSGGTVEKITIRSTVVTNWDQQQIIIPNKAFITQNLTNWTRNNNFTRRKIKFGLGYGTDVERAIAILEATVKEQENVRSYPPPRIWFNGFGEYGLEIECWIYVDLDFGFSTMSNVRRAILKSLREAGIEIPVPKRDVYLHDASEIDPMTDLQGAAGTLENVGEAPAEPEPEES